MSNNYNQTNIATMEMIYGEGYLSAGGDEEIGRIFGENNLSGQSVLDVGCGLGGAVITLVRDLHAEHVTGIDIDAVVLGRAEQLVSNNQLENQITLSLIEPGPFPLEDNRFDWVHITAVACHFDEYASLVSEIFRVLKPGGKVVGRDWFKINDSSAYRLWDDLLREKGLDFHFAHIEKFVSALEDAGFSEVQKTQRTDDIAVMAIEAVDRVDGELRSPLIDVLGEAGYAECQRWTRIRSDALNNNGIGQYQFLAIKPAKVNQNI